MTRFKKELIARGVQLEETLPFLPYNYSEIIIVNSEKCYVYTYDMRVGGIWDYYDTQLNVYKQIFEDD